MQNTKEKGEVSLIFFCFKEEKALVVKLLCHIDTFFLEIYEVLKKK